MTHSPVSVFAPLADSAPLDGSDIPDRLSLRDHVVEVEIGAFQQERGITQRVRFNLVADLSEPAEGSEDDVDAILSYDVFLDAITAELAGQRLNLLETLAEGVAARVLSAGGVARVFVRIEKLDRCDGALGVEIMRAPAQNTVGPDAVPDTPPARIFVLAASALSDPDLPAALDRIVAGGAAVICVEGPGARLVQSAVAQVQRRIDLLTLSQAAWDLAGRDPRCVVVDSRTELDWGLRHDQVSVWAPSKMVVDARDEAVPQSAQLPDLAIWLARQLGASYLDIIGTFDGALPETTIALRHAALAEIAR